MFELCLVTTQVNEKGCISKSFYIFSYSRARKITESELAADEP